MGTCMSETGQPMVLSSEPITTPAINAPGVHLAHFPKTDTPASVPPIEEHPDRPTTVAPILDPEHSALPIKVFDEQDFKRFYPDKPATDGISPIPPKPLGFQDAYLFPMLARNERLRLTMLWYYTRGLLEDDELLTRLQDKLNLARELIGWEFALMGILDNEVYTRVAVSGLPLAILPRRESTCAHTIHQPPGSVFMLANMINDWRFQYSPHVHLGGLRSYAGTPLRCKTETGEYVALGSVCVASNSQMEPLSHHKQATLVKFADMLTAEIVNSCQLKRQRQRRVMGDLISEIQTIATADNIEELVLKIVNQIYPDAHVFIQESPNESIKLDDQTPILFRDVRDNLWEDSEYIDSIIASSNQKTLVAGRAVRAAVARCSRIPSVKFLVVTTSNIQHVFDDIDSWFVERCSLLIMNLYQERLTKEAIDIKDRFFRNITHQLRTPIHGILGSCELLGEELASLDIHPPESPISRGSDAKQLILTANVSSYLKTIKSSGEELMSTINNLLKLNRWSDISNFPPTATLCPLRQLEIDLCNELQQIVPEASFADISIFFQNVVPIENTHVSIDILLLKECVQSLLMNAIQYTEKGSIVVRISTGDDFSALTFDIKDTGCGIKPGDRQRIFKPYEKANVDSRGAGLGLTLASKIANAMNGDVSLIWSEVGKGSHFRVIFREPGFACPPPVHRGLDKELKWLPNRFFLHGPADSPMREQLEIYLMRRGLLKSENALEALNVIDFNPDPEEFNQLLDSLDTRQISVCLLPAESRAVTLQHEGRKNLHFFTGPFHSSILDGILRKLDKFYEVRSFNLTPPTPTTFDVSLRLLENPSTELIKKVCAQPKLSALLVDDNPINLRIMSMYCEKRHIPYKTAVDGQEAVDIFEAGSNDQYPSLILMDLQMPNLDGVEACERIRALETQRSLPPSVIFVVSGQDSPADKTRSFTAGANDFFTKPVKLKLLDQRVQEYFESFTGPKSTYG